MKRLATLFYILMFVYLNACISVNLGGGSVGGKKSEGVQVAAPTTPFTVQKRMDVDGAWKSEKNGNTISYISDCQDPTDPTLDSIVHDAIAGLVDLKIESSESPTMLSREARRVVASGKVDGVQSKIDLLAFKRNHCIYILTYVGVFSAFTTDHAQFDKFISGFRAP